MPVRRFALPSLLAACVFTSLSAWAAPYPMQLQNCGYEVSLKQAPASVVTIGQAGTEMLYALGLGDKVVGTSLWFNAVLPQYKAINDKVPRLADNDPSFESVIGKRPALVVSQFEWMVGKDGVVGTREQFHDLGIATYAMPSDCEGKNNLKGADGTRTAAYDVQALYKSITQLAQLFDVQPQGERLVKDLRERQAKAVAKVKAAPGKYAMGSWGPGTQPHQIQAFMERKYGVKVLHAAYKGESPMVSDLISGMIQMTSASISTLKPYIESGRLRALAVTTKTRAASNPDVPTVAEAGVPGYEASAWHGVLAPRGTPEPVVQTLREAIIKVLADPALKARLEQDGIETVGSTPKDFNLALQAEIEKWRKVVDDAGIKLE